MKDMQDGLRDMVNTWWLQLIVALTLLAWQGNAFAQTDLPRSRELKSAPVDTSKKHTLLAEYQWMMYFVDFTRDDVLDFYSYEVGTYQDAERDSFPTFAASWPGGWTWNYTHNVLKLIPSGMKESELTKTITIKELQQQIDEEHAAQKSVIETFPDRLPKSDEIRNRSYPLPELMIVTAPSVRLKLHRGRFSVKDGNDQGPASMFEALIE